MKDRGVTTISVQYYVFPYSSKRSRREKKDSDEEPRSGAMSKRDGIGMRLEELLLAQSVSVPSRLISLTHAPKGP